MQSDRVRVLPFSAEEVRRQLTDFSHDALPAVAEKVHARYLSTYLTPLGCQTIVSELRYIDRDFLEDFAAYYVRCFEDYQRRCVRMHFFRDAFDENEFEKWVAGTSTADLEAGYLGFVVVKPLPHTIIGRTCVRTWEERDDENRFFPVTAPHKANLFGRQLEVLSVPFQEQDKEVAACASSALWSLFHNTGRRFQHAIPSPVEITRAASAFSRMDERMLPAGAGLNTLQIADAIRSVGLEPHTVGLGKDVEGQSRPSEYAAESRPKSKRTKKQPGAEPQRELVKLKMALAAYLRSGIACLLLTRHKDLKNGDKIGNHAITVLGYRCDEGAEILAAPETTALFKSAQMSRIYAHDDQIGPFASYCFEEDYLLPVKHDPEGQADLTERSFKAEPVNLVIPLYHKIRVPFGQIVRLTEEINVALNELGQAIGAPLIEKCVWDIELNELAQFRSELTKLDLAEEDRVSLLTEALPRFLWRVTAYSGPKAVMILLFDATDLLQGRLLTKVVPLDRKACEQVSAGLNALGNYGRPVVQSLGESLKSLVKATEASG